MKKILKGNYFLIFIYLFISILAFGKLPFTFFQQDEWAIYGYHLYWDKAHLSWLERLFTYEQFTHITPLSNFFAYLENRAFGLNFPPYAYFSIGIHIVNASFVFYLANLFFKNKFFALIPSLIFLVDYIPHQAITWTATTMGTAGAALFVLLSLIFLTKYTLYKPKITHLTLSIIFLLISIGFNETSIFMFLLVPIFWFIFSGDRNYKNCLKISVPVVLLGGFYFLSRIILMNINFAQTIQPAGLTQPSTVVYIFRIFTHPLKAISQSIIPMNMIIKAADKLVLLGYPHFSNEGAANPYVSQTIGADLISYALAIVILLFCVLVYRLSKKKNKGIGENLIIVSLIFISLSSLPFIFIPGTAGYFSLFEGRHLYLTSVFKSILVSSVLFVILQKGKRQIFFICMIFFAFFLGLNTLSIRKDLNIQMALAWIRKSILHQIESNHPKLPKRVIFYTESDTSYYGLPITEPILPFQSGFGQTLLLWYNQRGENYPACFFKGEFLYQILEEGYKECDGRGFGYFRKYNLLKKALVENNLSANDVIGIKFNSHTSSVKDISKEVRSKL